jgi:hypothetical protein
MRPYIFDIDPANIDADGICASQTPLAGGSLTIDGALTVGGAFDVNATGGDSSGISGRKIAFVFAADETGRTFTINGTSPEGFAQTSTVLGAAPSTVEDVKYWETITDISVDAATAGALTVGTVNGVITRLLPINYRAHEPATHGVDVTGTINYTIEESLEEIHPQLNAGTPENISWFSMEALTAKTADLKEPGELHSSAVRLVVNSYTDTAEIKWIVFQNEG